MHSRKWPFSPGSLDRAGGRCPDGVVAGRGGTRPTDLVFDPTSAC
ncbi:hypothetical protein [Motilibacter peucedani]|nr:hypothetical protein [Motilibacter peucedani]